MTLTEKILARAAGKAKVSAGENVWVKADILMTHDVCGPGTIGVLSVSSAKTPKSGTKTKW
jgi:3-isopropylmalate/(R)-2-methylmalate dehydratase large subunit